MNNDVKCWKQAAAGTSPLINPRNGMPASKSAPNPMPQDKAWSCDGDASAHQHLSRPANERPNQDGPPDIDGGLPNPLVGNCSSLDIGASEPTIRRTKEGTDRCVAQQPQPLPAQASLNRKAQ
jgi:hypothetical protein